MDTLIHWLKGLHLAPTRKQAGVGIHGQGQGGRNPGGHKGPALLFWRDIFFQGGRTLAGVRWVSSPNPPPLPLAPNIQAFSCPSCLPQILLSGP